MPIERRDLGYPFVPTFVAEIGHETHIIDVVSKADPERIERWIRYAQSQAKDTRFHLVVHAVPAIDQKSLDLAVSKRLGLFHHNDERLSEIRQPADLAVHVALPETRDLPRAIRPLLATPFKKIRDGDWRDGLEGAYQEVEQLARDYLVDGISREIIESFIGNGKNRHAVSVDEAKKLTLGGLGKAFEGILKKNQKDSLIEATIAMILESRNDLAHKRKDKAAEEKLRQQIGPNVYAIISCLEAVTS
ncbi:MAG: hypothetical protein AAFW97_03450 [Pseudomonadota bacterium]